MLTKALLIPKENQNVEIANNQSNLTSISEQNLNDVINTTEKNQDASDLPVKPSEPSDPSADLDNDNKNKGIDGKQDHQIVKKIQDIGATNNAENSPSSSTNECYYCPQRFSTRSELISHMDRHKELADARKDSA